MIDRWPVSPRGGSAPSSAFGSNGAKAGCLGAGRVGRNAPCAGPPIAYALSDPGGAAPAAGWPGVVVLHGLGGSKDDMAPVAQAIVSHGYAVVAYSARGSGTSTGNLELA